MRDAESTRAFLAGHDPGGDGAHGVAVCEVCIVADRWQPCDLQAASLRCVQDAIAWIEKHTANARLLAVGVDTLTEWNGGPAGWRPADHWLRQTYPEVRNSVAAPNSLFGSMPVGGAAFLTMLHPRLQCDDGWITEAHPKVCYHALTGRKHAWAEHHESMAGWLLQELGLDLSAEIFGSMDHPFDAALSILPALRGLNGDWPLDLHSLQDPRTGSHIHFAGNTHYWWPNPSHSSKRSNP